MFKRKPRRNHRLWDDHLERRLTERASGNAARLRAKLPNTIQQ